MLVSFPGLLSFSFSLSFSRSFSRNVALPGDLDREVGLTLEDACIITPAIETPAIDAVSLASFDEVATDAPRMGGGLLGPVGDFPAVLLARLARLLVEGWALNVDAEFERAG